MLTIIFLLSFSVALLWFLYLGYKYRCLKKIELLEAKIVSIESKTNELIQKRDVLKEYTDAYIEILEIGEKIISNLDKQISLYRKLIKEKEVYIKLLFIEIKIKGFKNG